LRVKVLGSSSGWPIPRLGCDCAQCTSTDPRDRRLRPSILLDGRVLVDAGPDLYTQLCAARAVPDSVVLTHSHADHVLGLYDLAKAGRLPLYCTPDTERALRGTFPRLDLRVVRIAPGMTFDLGEGLSAQGFDVEHGSERTFGYRFSGGAGETVVYLPDLGAPPSSRLARDADLLFLDGSTRERTQRGHLAMSEAIPLARRLRAGRVLFTHIGHRTGLHAELSEWLPDGFEPAYDGMEVDVVARERVTARGGVARGAAG
jgi:phosphoribosyl 1,2-cyclic phosphate phosphodiesterase